MGFMKNRKGERHGYLTVLRFSHKKGYVTYWWCRCDCGTEKAIQGAKLGKDSNSCGCLAKERTSKARKTHGLSKTRFYGLWNDMMMRCYNPNKERYNCYGGRGIKVCERWHTFQNFYDDMFAAYKKGLSLEREDVNGDYSPKNCSWIPIDKQCFNRQRPLQMITYNGETKPAMDWIRELDVDPSAIYQRIRKGWEGRDVLFGRRKYITMTDDQIERARRLKEEGKTLREIGRILGFHHGKIKNALDKP